MRSIYGPGDGGAKIAAVSSRFVERQTFPISDATLSNDGFNKGVHYPQFEGSGLFIEKCDYPATLILTDTQTGVDQSFVMSPGLRIDAPFKGLTIAGPSVPGAKATIIITKGGASYVNQYANPFIACPTYFHLTALSGVLQQGRIFVPPGAKFLEYLEFTIQGATLDECSVYPSKEGGVPYVRNNFTDPRNQTPYIANAAAIGSRACDKVQTVAGASPYFKATTSKMWLPFETREIRFNIVGTAFALPINIEAVFT